MRILGIRLMNINSLAGEWSVDFTDPAYRSEGIFAITGPTGAGKTSLLDVICLALYGRTPRLERVNKAGNDLMTRQTGECFAEVTFSTPAGTFRCHWSQHRARKKPDGELQTPRHEISNADTGQVIDNKIKTVEKRIEAVTGMDFVRFTQSMMLAQGGFAAFLSASADERAPILEQITGTGIYSEISIRVHERHRQESDTLAALEAELRGLVLLSPEQEAALVSEEHQRSVELEQQTQTLKQYQHRYEWKRRCVELDQKLAGIAADLDDWQQHNAAFDRQREQLARAQRALELAGDYSALQSLRQAQRDDENSLATSTARLPAQQALVAERNKSTKAAQSHHDKQLALLTEQRPLLREVLVLDSRIAQQKKSVADCRERFSACVQTLESQQQKVNAFSAQTHDLRQRLAGLRLHPDESDTSLLTRYEQDFEQKRLALRAQQDHIKTLMQEKNLKQWREQLQQIDQSLQHLAKIADWRSQQQSTQQQQHALQADSQVLDNNLVVLAERVTQQQAVVSAQEQTLTALRQQLMLQKTVRSLDTQRAQLREGQPCPLCGATEHPWAVHEPDADISHTSQHIATAEASLQDSRQQLQSLLTEQSQLQERRTQLGLQSQRLQHAYDKTEQQIQQLWQQSGLDNITEDVESQQHALTQQRQAVQNTLDTLDAEQAQLTTLDEAARSALEQMNHVRSQFTLLQHLGNQLQSMADNLSRLQAETDSVSAELDSVTQTLAQMSAQREQLLGDKDPVQQEATLETALARAEQQLVLAQRSHEQADREWHALQQSIERLQQHIKERSEKISVAEQHFSKALSQQQFDSEQDYLAARLPDDTRQHLSAEATRLQQLGAALGAVQQQTRSELDSLKQQALTEATLDTLQTQLAEQQTRVNQQREWLGGIRRDLDNNRQARDKQGQQAARIDAQKTELARWAALHELIGSSDGKKFRNFAQGLTFELMIQHANVQLARMTERYLLVRNLQQPLDLDVIDQYQAGEMRSTRNLSGGESFIVSLALALGLSAMASRNVRVDSLFLDEGFGTLDEDALDVALDTLGSLQQQGKLIGVISHVSALKERISTQINVIPGPGGRSRLSGPGCQAR